MLHKKITKLMHGFVYFEFEIYIFLEKERERYLKL